MEFRFPRCKLCLVSDVGVWIERLSLVSRDWKSSVKARTERSGCGLRGSCNADGALHGLVLLRGRNIAGYNVRVFCEFRVVEKQGSLPSDRSGLFGMRGC